MNRHGQRREEAGPKKPRLRLASQSFEGPSARVSAEEPGQGRPFVRISRFRNESVDQGNQKDPSEKAGRSGPGPLPNPQSFDERRPAFEEDLDEGNIDHDAGGKTERDGKKALIRPAAEKYGQAAESGRKSGRGGHGQGRKDVSVSAIIGAILPAAARRSGGRNPLQFLRPSDCRWRRH
jgi:hypothetical protein